MSCAIRVDEHVRFIRLVGKSPSRSISMGLPRRSKNRIFFLFPPYCAFHFGITSALYLRIIYVPILPHSFDILFFFLLSISLNYFSPRYPSVLCASFNSCPLPVNMAALFLLAVSRSPSTLSFTSTPAFHNSARGGVFFLSSCFSLSPSFSPPGSISRKHESIESSSRRGGITDNT